MFFAVLLSTAQQRPKTHEQCLKLVPGDWGPNFGEEWHRNEATYWACRLGVPIATVKAWQQAAGVIPDGEMAQEIKPVALKGQKLVLYMTNGGTANCYGLSVLRQYGPNWKAVWVLPQGEGDQEGIYCMGECPALQVGISGDVLTFRSPISTDPNDEACKQYRWDRKRFRWTGSTFVPFKKR